jgi:hypothetical protein
MADGYPAEEIAHHCRAYREQTNPTQPLTSIGFYEPVIRQRAIKQRPPPPPDLTGDALTDWHIAETQYPKPHH